MPPSYGRSVAIAVFVFALTFSPYAHAADTSAFGINDPFADAIQLWSAVLSSIDSLANQIASALQLHQTLTFTAKPHAAKNLQQPVALAASAALATQSPPEIATTSGSASDASITPQQPQTTGPPEPTSDQTTQSPFVKSAVSGPLAKSPEFSQSQASNQALAATPTSALQAEAGFVTQTQFNAAMSALGRSVRQLLAQSNPNPFPEYVGGDGNNLNPYAAASAIDNLSNVIITNPTITGLTASEIPALNYFPATNTIAVAFGGTGLSAAPTYGQLLLGNGSGGYNLVSTSSLGITGGGGGGTPGGSDTQVQFDSGGSFAGSSNFTFSSSTNKLTITNASTSNLTASYASTSNLTVSTGFFFGSASGILKAVAGVVSAALVNLASDVTGILPVANGGTGWSSLAAGAIPYGNGSSALATTSSGTPGYVLALLNGVPTWTATTTLANISGTLGVGSGGTGATTFGQGWIYSSGSTSALAASTSPTVNYITATSTTATSTFRGGAVFALGGGNVVIGTTTANHEFDVWQLNNTAIGLTTTDPALTVTNGGSTVGNGSTVAFQGVDSVGTEVTLARISDISTALTAGAASGNLAFFTRNAGTQQQDLTILAAGNVGIGTTTPGSLLSVQGVANWTGATSTLYSTGGINLTAGCFSIQGTCLPTGGPFAALTVPTSGASFTGSISGTTLTVTAVASGTIYPGQQILGSGISTITTVYVDDSGTGGTGTYTLTVSYGTIASESMSTVSSDVFAGPYAGNTSAGGTSDTALGFLAGSSLTTPASPSTANPQNDTFLGFGAGADCTTCRETTAIGAMAGNALTGSGGGVEDSLDTFVGSYAGVNTVEPAINDTFVGQKAGSGNTTGSDNTYVGVHSSIYDATSSNNTYVGYATSNGGADAGANVLVGSQAGTNFGPGAGDDVGIGYEAMSGGVVSGTQLVAVGWQAGENVTSASQSVLIGAQAGQSITGGSNTAIGYQAGKNLGSTYSNVLLGVQAGLNITSGQGNICLGDDSCSWTTTGSNQFVAGSGTLSRAVITDVYFGSGPTATSPTNYTIHGSGGLGQNTIGANLILAGGIGVGNGQGGALIFQTAPTGSSGTATSTLAERMRITNAGLVGIGTSTPYSVLTLWGPDTSGNTSSFVIANSASTTEFNVLDNGNATLAGTLTQNSDQRLKTNIQSLDASSSLAAIDALNPVTFNWINVSQGSTTQLGFIAQQAQQIFPNLVATTSPTALTPNGTLSLNYIGLISPIVAAIQALSADITSVENTIASFAQSFATQILTADDITVNNSLCLAAGANDPNPVCITKTQLAALLSQSAAAGLANPAPSSPTASLANPTPGDATDTTPVIEINGDNPGIIEVGTTYTDLGATITGPQADLNLGITTYVNGAPMNPVQLDTSTVATDTIAYVATDSQGLTSTSTRTVIIDAAPSIVPSTDPSTSQATSTAQ